MFSKLFGAKEPPKQQINVSSAKEKLENQIENIEMRIKKIENTQ